MVEKYDLDIFKLYEPLYARPLSEVRLEGYIAMNMQVTENNVAYIKLSNAILEEYSELMGNFIVYMLYRYNGYPRLACETALLLADLILAGIEPLEAARMFSSEVEYSDINIEVAKSLFGQGDMYGN